MVAERIKITRVINRKLNVFMHAYFHQNFCGGIHGGAIAAFSERMAIACARTVVAEDKEIFLGELGISYLSAAPHNVSSFHFEHSLIV